MHPVTIGVLALQGAFSEHIQLLRVAASAYPNQAFEIAEVRTREQLDRCDALVIPGGESTAISLVAERGGMLGGLREFVKTHRKPTWGTCAGLILLSESANRTKATGQELIGGLDVRVNRNHFGRQTESFQADLALPFLKRGGDGQGEEGGQGGEEDKPFRAIFIRAPIVERILSTASPAPSDTSDLISAPSAPPTSSASPPPSSSPANPSPPSPSRRGDVEILATLPGRSAAVKLIEKAAGDEAALKRLDDEAGDIVAVRQGNVFGTSFHPELSGDARLHVWWVGEVLKALGGRREGDGEGDGE